MLEDIVMQEEEHYWKLDDFSEKVLLPPEVCVFAVMTRNAKKMLRGKE